MDAMLVLDLLATNTDVIPGVGLHADVTPQIRAVVDGVRHEAVGECEVGLGLRVIGALDSKIDRLAMPLLALGIHVVHGNYLVLEHRGRSQEQDEVMAPLCRDLGRRARFDERKIDVVDHHLRAVLLAPLLRVLAVEPLVVAGDEVAPLENLERLGRARGAHMEERAGGGGNAGGAGSNHEITACWRATSVLCGPHGASSLGTGKRGPAVSRARVWHLPPSTHPAVPQEGGDTFWGLRPS